MLRALGAVFAAAGHELFLVGGSVRDALLGRLTEHSDLDFTTDARPEQMVKLLRPWADALWDTGIEFGTVGVGKRVGNDEHRLGSPRSGLTVMTRCLGIRPSSSATTSTTTWCAATSP